MSTLITSNWLRAHGFHWHQLERQPARHWTLDLSDVIPNRAGLGRSPGDFIVELARGIPGHDFWWFCWFRADYAGRYSRFLSAGDLTGVQQIQSIISGLIGRPFDKADTWGGRLLRPELAAKYHTQSDLLHYQMAVSSSRSRLRDEADDIHRTFAGHDWFHHVEIEDDACCVVYVNRWPSYDERKGLPSVAGIEQISTGLHVNAITAEGGKHL